LYRLPRRFRQFVARVETLERRASEATATIKTIQSNRAADRQTVTTQNSQVRNRIEQLCLRAEGINQAFVDRARTIEDSAARTKAEIEAQLSGIETTFVDHWRGIVDQKLRIEAFLESSTAIPGADRSPAKQIANEQTHLLDPLYLSFEDRYRGTRSEIKERQSVYLQLVEACARETGGAPVVDLGCGRGEWLELLSESGIMAWGCDLNRIAVEECRERGSTVQIGDALELLKSTPDNSCSTVTGFHIIEHVSFEFLVSLLDHSLRVLRRGGAIILETPNPANLIVAAERFYYDPTHRNPLPSELMAYLLKSRGFQQVEVLPLHPVEWNSRKDYADPMLAYLQDKLFGPQDYGVVGRKIA
jgi:O-antigen chain-terminating methyltransferase